LDKFIKIIMMKNYILFIASTVCFYTVYAQGIMAKWPQLKAFHEVMSSTFHASETGNLAPIKKRSEEMANKADSLLNSKVPDEFDSPQIKKSLLKLKDGSNKLNQMIKLKKSTDTEITKALSDLHDVFHEIIGLCGKEEHH